MIIPMLKDKVVVITGASSGLGEQIAYKVAALGGKVALVARSSEKLKKVGGNIKSKNGIADYFVCDIQNLNEVKKTVDAITDKLGNIDILINNAGIWTDENLEKENPEMRKKALLTNTLGNIQFTYEVLPHFQKLNKGYIFNVISTSGVGDIPSGDNSLWKTYGASKWAMTGFTKALRDSLKDTKIKVTGFHPGGFDSGLYESAGRPNPHGQPWMMKAADLADIIVFALTRPDDMMMERIVVSKAN